jgi:hypothetical protein
MNLFPFLFVRQYAFIGNARIVSASCTHNKHCSCLGLGDDRRRWGITFLVLLLGFISCAVLAQSSSPNTGKPVDDKKMNGLLVYGKGFMFSATEPDGWHGDTGEIARHYQSNLIFIPEDKQSRTAHVNIRIRVNRKETADPSEDMQTDMTSYKTQYPKVKFSDLSVSHPKYKISAKLFYVENDFYEYVIYIDPGPDANRMFSVVMSKDSKPATAAEMKTFQAVLQSLVWISGNIQLQ